MSDLYTTSKGRFRIQNVLPKSWVSKRYENKLRATVRKGSKTLDRLVPGWFGSKVIKLDKLDLRSSCNCVFGQVESAISGEKATLDLSGLIRVGYNEGYLVGNDTPADVANVLSVFEEDEYGYTYASVDEFGTQRDIDRSYQDLEVGTSDLAFAILQDEWEKQITKRREEAKYGAKKVLV
jgi:hypothetical protein